MIKYVIMNIETTKLELMQLLLQTRKESLLAKLKQVFEEEESTFYSVDIAEIQQRAEASLEDIEKGQTRPILEFKKDVENWKKQQAM
jgi:hypothetical protein